MDLESVLMASRENSHLHSLHVPRFRHYALRTDMHPPEAERDPSCAIHPVIGRSGGLLSRRQAAK
jgi:hypothetical protein